MGGIYYVVKGSNQRTTSIVDRFESRSENGTLKYSRMIIKNFAGLHIDWTKDMYIDAILKRGYCNTGRMEFTTFSDVIKKGAFVKRVHDNFC